MSCTARHDASNVPIKPLLDSALDLSEVKYMQLTKAVLKKTPEPLLANLTEQKLKRN